MNATHEDRFYVKADSKYIIVSGSATILENLFLVLLSVISEMSVLSISLCRAADE